MDGVRHPRGRVSGWVIFQKLHRATFDPEWVCKRKAEAMKVMMILVVAMGALVARESGAQAAPAGVVKFTNVVASFQTLAGRGFTNVSLVSVSPDGLIWAATYSALVSGRVPLADLSADTRARLGIPESLLALKNEREAARWQAVMDEADRKRRELAGQEMKAEREGLIRVVEKLQAAGVFGDFTWKGTVARVKVGRPFAGLDFDQKKQAVEAVFLRIAMEQSGVRLIRLMDRYSNKEIGSFDQFGLHLD